MNWTTRHYRPGDEPRLVQLWNDAYEGYGGFIPRTAALWTHNIAMRPAVSAEDIVLAEGRGVVQAFGVLGPKGRILEFAVETNLSHRRRKHACWALLEALEDRARRRGDSFIEVVAPFTDTDIDEALRSADYTFNDHDSMCVGVLNAKQLVLSLLERKAEQLPRDGAQTFSLEILPGSYQVSAYDRLHVSFRDKGVLVEEVFPASDADSACRITTDLETLTEIIFGQLDFARAAGDRRIQLDNGSVLRDAESLFSLLSIDAPLFVPPSDVF